MNVTYHEVIPTNGSCGMKRALLSCDFDNFVSTWLFFNKCFTKQMLANKKIDQIFNKNLFTLEEYQNLQREFIKYVDRIFEEKEHLFISANRILLEKRNISICKSLDNLIGGIQLGAITELVGIAGTGKSQLCHQIAVNAQHLLFGGRNAEILYVDTEGKFRSERILQMANACLKENLIIGNENFSSKQILDRTHFYRCKEPHLLMDLIFKQLPQFVIDHPNVRLVIIDSLTYHFRYFEKKREVKFYPMRIAQQLRKIAKNNIAIVVTNQVAFDAAKSCNQPALGGVWRSAPSRRLLLERLNDSSPIRYATVLKGTFKNVKTASYVLLKEGIRDISK